MALILLSLLQKHFKTDLKIHLEKTQKKLLSEK
jgi:hypothetical protein